MYSRWHLAAKYLHYYFSASSGKGHGIHSPFVFDFITSVLNDRQSYPAYEQVELLREELLRNNTLIRIEDLGAGSAVSSRKDRRIRDIARHSVKSKKYGRLLYRMVKKYQPHTIVELGTSLGLTTSYFSLANKDATVVTIEGAGEVAAVAETNFKRTGLDNIILKRGNFDVELPHLLQDTPEVDLAFIDGNHQEGPTLTYFEEFIPKVKNHSILVFDDIHWSRGMENAWQKIRGHASVRCSIDLFFIGIVFFRDEFKEKQDFRIRF
jgi:predicted O-methyltransferase YrrM